MKLLNPYLTRPIATACVFAALCLAGTGVCAQQADPPEEDAPEPAIEGTRLILDRWINTRRAIAKEKSEWALGKESLLDRIELLKSNIANIQKEIDEQKKKLAGFDQDMAKLEATNEKLKQSADGLSGLVERMESRTVKLLEGAPQPLIETVKPLAVQLPGYGKNKKAKAADKGPADPNSPGKGAADPAEKSAGDKAPEGDKQAEDTKPPVNAKASAKEGQDAKTPETKAEPALSRRVENVVGVLYLVNKFAGKIEPASELVARPDGSKLSVSALYLGTSYGFYVDDENASASTGWPTPTGWKWAEADSAAANIRKAIQVLNKDQPAAFVGLPVEVK